MSSYCTKFHYYHILFSLPVCAYEKNQSALVPLHWKVTHLFFFNSVKMEEQYTNGLWCDKYFPALSDCLRPSLSPDSPRSFWWYHLTCWLLSAVGVVCILVAHEHYSVDVVVAYFITSRLFWWYHTMANLQVRCGLYCPSINMPNR